MAIPPFNEHGWLPDGIHDCTLEEAAGQSALWIRPLGRSRRLGGIPSLRGVLSTSPVGTGSQKRHTENTAMINNEAQLQQAIEQIQGLCRAIDSLRADIFPKNPKNFAIMAEGPVDEIRKLQADIDAYINRLEAVDTTA